MTLVIQKPTSGKLVMANSYIGIDDPDAATYIAAVEAADGQALETATRVAIHSFVKGCKADGIWPAIKASCILAGARTLNGALVPLVGAAPTNVGGLFAQNDYNRKTGLVGNGTNKWLNTNRAASSDPLSNVHLAVYANTRNDSNLRYLSAGAAGAGSILEMLGNPVNGFRARVYPVAQIYTHGTIPGVPCLIGVRRSGPSSYDWRFGGQFGSQVDPVNTVGANGNYAVFAINNGASATDARLAFYSIGESLDLALLDSRVTTLINALAAAIP